MTDISHPAGTLKAAFGTIRPKRLAVAALLILLALAPGDLGNITREMMVDAYVNVSVFVAITLLLFYGAERLFGFDIATALGRARAAQVPLAALLGTTPGCGGAVVVVAAYGTGRVSFGAVVAALTATMGDAAFLLIATRPDAAAVVLPLSFAVGIASGWIIDALRLAPPLAKSASMTDMTPRIGRTLARHWAYLVLVLPGFAFGVTQLGGAEIPAGLWSTTMQAIGLGGVALGLAIWALSPLHAMTHSSDAPVTRMAEETAFISVWVIAAFLAYEYAVAFAGLDLQAFFASAAPLLPLIAIGIGFVPGCGPQVLVTTLYINGLIPFAALIGNAISNDGDALFPALAVNPRAALWATLYSGIPALIVAYAMYWLAPNFLN